MKMKQIAEGFNVRTSDRCEARSPLLMIAMMSAVLSGWAWNAAADEPPGGCEPHWDNAIGQLGMNATVRALTVFDDGSGAGPALYAGGSFTVIDGLEVNHIAKWDGTSWSPLGGGMSGFDSWTGVYALTVYDDGSGQALYAGGLFTFAGGETVNSVAKWDGSTWSALGSGVGGGPSDVYALTVFDDGSGPALYAGGRFTTAEGATVNRIAKWDGKSWSALGSGMSRTVHALTVFDDGTGPALYAGGLFSTASGLTVNRIAKWDGESWSALGSGVNNSVRALTVFDDGSGAGPALYAGGGFTAAGGMPASRIAKWDGTSWSPLGSGVGNPTVPLVRALAVIDDGLGVGPAMYIGGRFTSAGGVAANRIAKWNGQSWAALGSGVNSEVFVLLEFDDGSDPSPALYAGGDFTAAGGVPANRIARWGCPSEPDCAPADLNCDGVVDGADLLILLSNWGACADCDDCLGNLNDDCTVDGADLLILLSSWG